MKKRSFHGIISILSLLCIMVHVSLSDQYKSAVIKGNWSDPVNWQKSVNGGSSFASSSTIPGMKSSDTVIISDENYVLLDTSVTIGQLTVGSGKSGILIFDSTGISRKLTISGNLRIQKGAMFATPRKGLRTMHNMIIGGDVVSDGRFNMTANAQVAYCNVTFSNKMRDQVISGAGGEFIFRGITIAKDTVIRKVIAERTVTTVGAAVQFEKGTWEQTKGNFVCNVNQTIPPTGALVISGTGGLVKTNYGITVKGKFLVATSGKVDIGTRSGKEKLTVKDKGIAEFLSGTVSIGGQLRLEGGSTKIDGAILKLDPQCSPKGLPGKSNAFEVLNNSNLDFNAGSLTIVNPILEKGEGREVFINSSGSLNFGGATIVLGDTTVAKAGADGFEVENKSQSAIHSVIIQGGNMPGRSVTLMSNLSVTGVLTYINSPKIKTGEYALKANKTED